MLIDFHTHAFPDKIASRAMLSLSEKAGLPYYTDGTLADTDRKMQDWGVDLRVMLSIATSPKQQTNVNDFAIQANRQDNICGFGSVHPQSPDALAELERIKAAGLPGVKLHPEYQGFYIDDQAMFPIYDRCVELDLIVSFHAGRDLGYPDALHASPARIARLAKRYGPAKFVMAHFGGSLLEEEVLSQVAGCGFYLDTSFSVGNISGEMAEKIIRKHGADKVLFASDCPWASPRETYEFIDSLRLSSAEKELIFYRNAMKLLKK